MATHKPINILEAFAAAPPPLDYVLPNMVAGTVGALVSPGGAGKSMLALQLAAQIAGGPDLLEVVANVFMVVYYQAETGRATPADFQEAMNTLQQVLPRAMREG